MEASFEYSNTLSSVLLFQTSDDAINKEIRTGPKGYRVIRFVASSEIVDLEGDMIDLQVLAKIMPIMLKQGGRIQSFHSNHPGGEFFDWGFTKYKGADSIWTDVEIYDDFPSQQDNLRRILLPEGHKERINGLSLGGFKLAKKRECDAIRCWTRITDFEGWEFSFVDKMANPLAENIENQIENMEFDSLNKEQLRDYNTNHDVRDSKGRFSSEPQISSIETITKTSYDNSDNCECSKHLDKGEYENDKKKPKEEVAPKDESTEEVDVDVEIKAKEEDEPGEEAEPGEETEPMEGEPPMESEEQTEAEGLAVINSKLDTLMAALNVENLYKGKEKEMDEPKYVEFEGKKYIRKGDNLELVKEEAPEEPETPETTEDKTEVPDLAKLEKKFEDKFKAFSEEFMKAAKSETEVSSETENPAQQEIKEDDQEQPFFKKGSTAEERLAQAYPRMN